MKIQTDDDGNVIGTTNDARIALLNRINDANDEARADELLAVNDDGTTEKFVVQDAEGNQTQLTDDAATDPAADAEIARLAAESGEQPAEQTTEPAAQENEDGRLITRKINGKDVTKTFREWMNTASKVEAADVYLREASALRNQATRPAPTQAAQSVTPVVDYLAIARAIQMGSEEEAVAALQTIAAPVRPSVTTDDVRAAVTEQLTFKEAISTFNSEFSDLVADPVLHQMVLDTDQRLIAQGDRRPYLDRYRDIGEQVRGVAKSIAAKFAPAPKAPAAPVVDKLARKAAANPVPKAASQKTVSSVEEEADESTASIIAGIAKSRGGPQWMNGPATRQ